MKLSKTRRSGTIAFNMTPMIDIVFLLIIFFMTVSQITRTVDYPVNLPTVENKERSSEGTSVTINVSAEEKILLAGREVSLDECIRIVNDRVRENGSDVEQVRIQIRCDRDCKSGIVNRLVERLSQLGFTQVRVAFSPE